MAENNNEVAKVAINDIGTEEDFIKAVDSTIKNFDDGDGFRQETSAMPMNLVAVRR